MNSQKSKNINWTVAEYMYLYKFLLSSQACFSRHSYKQYMDFIKLLIEDFY